MQMWIYSSLPKMVEYDYKYDYVDWYLQIEIWMYYSQNEYINKLVLDITVIKVCKFMHICAHMCHNIQFPVLGL